MHMMKQTTILLGAALLLVGVSCGSDPMGPTVDSGSHWLTSCAVDSDCDNMACACGICTPVCDVTYACGGLGDDVVCVLPSSLGVGGLCGDQPPAALCLPECETAADCDSPDLGCVAGYCEPVRLAPCAEAPTAPPRTCLSGDLPVSVCVADADGTFHTEWTACADDRVSCSGDEGCDEGFVCNAETACLPDPSCPECEVCLGWCVVASGVTCASDAACDLGDVCEEGICGDALCPPEDAPVCGVDGADYVGPCAARAMHVEVAYDMSCGSRACTDEMCGPAPSIAACPDRGSRDVVCEADPGGLCRWSVGPCEPVFCTEEWAPMCGEDGNTYSNACFMAAAGIEAAHPGECECGPESCGPVAPSLSCEDGSSRGVSCEPSPSGTCEWVFDVCEPSSACSDDRACPPWEFCVDGGCQPVDCLDVWDPVCGVDGVTYPNACSASAEHVEVAAAVACEERCGGNEDCAPGLVCTLTGVCEPPCEVNCLVEDPVCGEDGVTYPCGEADAACHGVRSVSPGACE